MPQVTQNVDPADYTMLNVHRVKVKLTINFIQLDDWRCTGNVRSAINARSASATPEMEVE